jgi:hypothetical protein
MERSQRQEILHKRTCWATKTLESAGYTLVGRLHSSAVYWGKRRSHCTRTLELRMTLPIEEAARKSSGTAVAFSVRRDLKNKRTRERKKRKRSPWPPDEASPTRIRPMVTATYHWFKVTVRAPWWCRRDGPQGNQRHNNLENPKLKKYLWTARPSSVSGRASSAPRCHRPLKTDETALG